MPQDRIRAERRVKVGAVRALGPVAMTGDEVTCPSGWCAYDGSSQCDEGGRETKGSGWLEVARRGGGRRVGRRGSAVARMARERGFGGSLPHLGGWRAGRRVASPGIPDLALRGGRSAA